MLLAPTASQPEELRAPAKAIHVPFGTVKLQRVGFAVEVEDEAMQSSRETHTAKAYSRLVRASVNHMMRSVELTDEAD